MSMWGPRAWAQEFRVQIPALPFNAGQVTSPNLGFLIWKMGLLREPATQACCENSRQQVEGLRAHQLHHRCPGAYHFTFTVNPCGWTHVGRSSLFQGEALQGSELL